MARKSSNPLLHLSRAEKPYALEWEAVEAAPAPRPKEETEARRALWAAAESGEF